MTLTRSRPSSVLESVVATEEAGAKATICHRPPGNPGNQHTLSVGGSAVPAHLAHGDLIGECGESDVLSNQEQQQELKELRDAERELQQLDQEFDREQDRLDREAGRAAAAEQRAADRDAAAEGRPGRVLREEGPRSPPLHRGLTAPISVPDEGRPFGRPSSISRNRHRRAARPKRRARTSPAPHRAVGRQTHLV